MVKNTLKIRKIDEIDCKILNILQTNCRASLTEIASFVGLSVDSTRKRIQKLENIYFYPRVQIRPRKLGFNNIVDVKVKLNNHSETEIKKFIEYLIKEPRVVELFEVSGEWDISLVILSKDANDLGNITLEIRNKFGKIINSWSESTTLKAYKFESYDLEKLKGFIG